MQSTPRNVKNSTGVTGFTLIPPAVPGSATKKGRVQLMRPPRFQPGGASMIHAPRVAAELAPTCAPGLSLTLPALQARDERSASAD